MSTKKQTREQLPKQALKVEVKTALPWTLIILMAIAGAAFVGGWQARSGEITMTDVQQAIAQSKK